MQNNDFISESFQGATNHEFSNSEKTRTSLRLQYEAEARVLRRQMGGIESIRKDLGLNRRKICQLLLVDPSTWTRWTQDESKVPPHIYKALQWYLVSLEKYPMLHPLHQISITKEGVEMEKQQWAEERQKLERKLNNLEYQLHEQRSNLLSRSKVEHDQPANTQEKTQGVGLGWKLLLLFNTILLLFFLGRLL